MSDDPSAGAASYQVLKRTIHKRKGVTWQPLSQEAVVELIDTLTRERDEAEERTVGVCEGCGSSWTPKQLKESGHRSCCPERKMLSAKEWHARAETAEARCRDLEAFLKRREEELDALGGKYSECAHAIITAEARSRELEAENARIREALMPPRGKA
jgi:hypothetical protein